MRRVLSPKGAIVLSAAVILIALAMLTACSGYNDKRGRGDAPVGPRNSEARDIYEMPDQFSNLSTVCIGPDLVIVTTRDAPPAVVPNSENCTR